MKVLGEKETGQGETPVRRGTAKDPEQGCGPRLWSLNPGWRRRRGDQSPVDSCSSL